MKIERYVERPDPNPNPNPNPNPILKKNNKK